MKIAIIGAGWYGCHLACVLKEIGLEVVIYEAADKVFSAASSHNQNRLHLGFHYPRSHYTRCQSRDGFNKFLQTYGFVTSEKFKNLYAIDDSKSIVDFPTYKLIMSASGLAFDEVDVGSECYRNLDGCLSTDERVIDHRKASKFFQDQLKENLRFNHRLDGNDLSKAENGVTVFGEFYDYVINCTWGAFKAGEDLDIFFEPCITLLYRSTLPEVKALTIMDGEFCSLYPYVDDIYTLTSVKNTPLNKCLTYIEAVQYIKKISDYDVKVIKHKFEDEISYYYPSFVEHFHYHGFYTGIKTKLNINSDSREAFVRAEGPEIFVFSGKIDAIFHAEEIVRDIIFGA